MDNHSIHESRQTRPEPKKIFVLRNNDLGDVLVSTPLLSGLRIAYPNCHIAIGVGKWAKSLLENNTDIDEIISFNAPWHNKQNCKYPANSPKTFLEGLIYVFFSKEARNITKKHFSHGIDVLGSRQGSWLMRRAGIPYCFGVKGYAGGDNWCNMNVNFKEDRKVAEAALAFIPLIGSNFRVEVETRPIINLKSSEISWAKNTWKENQSETKHIIIAPGGGFPEKCWGDQNYLELIKLLLKNKNYQIRIIGSEEDKNRITIDNNVQFVNLCGKLSIRESAAMVSNADFVITNSSLCMHLAGTFKIPSITLLGDWYDSAKLHHKQWGYPEGIILGKEKSKGTTSITSVNKAYSRVEGFLLNQAFTF